MPDSPASTQQRDLQPTGVTGRSDRPERDLEIRVTVSNGVVTCDAHVIACSPRHNPAG